MDTPETNIDRLLKARAEINEQLRQHKTNTAVLFTDVVASTKYFDRYGDTAGFAMVDRHAQLGARIVREFDGRVVKTIGDSVMAEFSDPVVCVRSAIELQRKLYSLNEELPERDRLQLRVGINYGSCFRQDGDLFGDAVNVAARITKHTGPGQILISSSVHRAIPKDSKLICSSLGEMDLKGKEAKEEIFEVVWTDSMTYSILRTSNTVAVARGELVSPGLRVEDLAQQPEDMTRTSAAQSPLVTPKVASVDTPTIRADRADGAVDPRPRIETASHRTPSHTSNFGYEARYIPGTELANRYRVVSPLGKGGMGEVYRAEDLKLGQPVALKFLPASLLRNADAVERFHREVRLARQVSHPNVCRVFDVGEADGTTSFISMEYVDGEDLSSLIRRIGRVPADKALDIARQVCAGLAAAHEYGIIHRDLKPANIMLDGRGRVRIMDFGLAAVSLDARTDDARAGTPAYMSPEQIAGGEITAQSDLYSLGLVLYEIFTGKRPFESKTFDEMIRQRERGAVTLPSHYVKEIDPLIERVILRCLERAPEKRPTSAFQVAAALPGGDPLAAALAAGETPSPEMVAAAGEEGSLQPWKAWMLVGSIALLLACAIVLSQHAYLNNLVPGEKSPEVLSATAREIASSLGYTARPVDDAYWFDVSGGYLPYLSQIPAPERYRRVSEDFPSPLRFSYRQSPTPMTPYFGNTPGIIQWDNPVPTTPGDMTISLDTEGRFQSFRVIPFPQQDSTQPSTSSLGWPALFERAGLDFSQAKTAVSDWYANQMMDQQYAWDVVRDGKSVQVRGATYKGRKVLFEVLGPWDRAAQTLDAQPGNRYVGWFFAALLIGLDLICLLIARKNMRTGRGDTKGALRGAMAIFVLGFLFLLLVPHRSSDPRWISQWWQLMVGESAGTALQWWLFYMALEPYIRRTYPQALISWNRLLAGNPRDVLVGRDVLFGVGFGMLIAILDVLSVALPAWFPIKGVTPFFESAAFWGIGAYMAHVASMMSVAMLISVLSLTIVFLVWNVFRSKTAGLLAVGCLFVIIGFKPENIWVGLVCGVLTGSLIVLCLSRSGLLGLIAAVYTWFTLGVGSWTTDFSRWYAPRGVAAMLVVIAIAVYGFWTSTSGRKRFGTAFDD
jgi:class 3 adenylate cyclase/predicted Ser/Thr protein kinase